MSDQIQPTPTPTSEGSSLDEMVAQHQIKLAELEAATVAHEERLADEPHLQALSETAEPYHVGEALAFVKDKAEKIVSPLDLAALGLPELHEDGRTPLAVILDSDRETGVVKSARLIVKDSFTANSLFYLEEEHPAFSKSDKPSLKWRYSLNAEFKDKAQKLETVVDSPGVVTVKIDYDRSSYGRQSRSNNQLSVVRAPVSPEEARLQNPKTTEAKHKRTGRLGKLVAGLALATAVSNMVAPPHEVPAAPRTFESDYLRHKDVRPNEKAAIEARKMFEAGDVAGLEAVIAQSEFAKPLLEKGSFEEVAKASNIQELDAAMNTTLSKLDIGYKTVRDSKPGAYTGFKDDELDTAKMSALGILDGVNFMGPIIAKGKKFNIELVQAIYSKGDEKGGLYIQNPDKPTLRLSPANSNRTAMADDFEHEAGHHEDLTDNTTEHTSLIFLRGDLKYGPHGSGNGEVGVDIPSEYGGTDSEEHVAEMINGLFGPNSKLNADEKTTLQEELEALLASMEDAYPGISAYAYKNALTNKPDIATSVNEKLGDAAHQAREKSALIVLGFVLIEAGLKARYDKTKKQLDDQKAAGVR